MESIIPCPCGGMAIVQGGRSLDVGHVVIVGCKRCGKHLEGQPFPEWKRAQESAIDGWNLSMKVA